MGGWVPVYRRHLADVARGTETLRSHGRIGIWTGEWGQRLRCPGSNPGLRIPSKFPPAMYQATWNGTVIAASDQTQEVDGNIYFPLDAVEPHCIEDSDTTSVCPWKGTANYYHVVVDGERNPDAGWMYRSTKPKAKHIEGHVAFWKGVQVSKA